MAVRADRVDLRVDRRRGSALPSQTCTCCVPLASGPVGGTCTRYFGAAGSVTSTIESPFFSTLPVARIQRLARVVADEQDPALAVRVHDRLIRGTSLKVVMADEPQVDGILRARDSRHESGADGRQSELDPDEHGAPPAAARGRPPS